MNGFWWRLNLHKTNAVNEELVDYFAGAKSRKKFEIPIAFIILTV